MSLFSDKRFSAMVLGHLIVDMINGQRSVLMTFLSVPLQLSNSMLGLFSTLYVLIPALLQPVFGYIADRIGSRWIGSGGLLWMISFFGLALFIPGKAALVFLVIAALGSGAFHPVGASQAILSGRYHKDRLETTAASLFFLFGQGGYFIGPVLAGLLLENLGLKSLLLLSLLGVPVVVLSLQGLKQRDLVSEAGTNRQSSKQGENRAARSKVLAVAALVIIAGFHSWAQQNLVTFVPKYLSDLGQSASAYGMIVAIYGAGLACGNVLGGSLADRVGKRPVIVVCLTLASVFLFSITRIGVSFWLYPVLALTGIFIGCPYSLIVVLAQRLVPGGMSTVSGLVLGYIFVSGGLGTLASGFLADAVGFMPVFYLSAGILMISALFGFVVGE